MERRDENTRDSAEKSQEAIKIKSVVAQAQSRMAQSTQSSQLKSALTLELSVESARLSQYKDVLKSQSAQSEKEEATLKHREKCIEEKSDVCKRQEQNICDLRCGIDQCKLLYNTELRNAEALSAKCAELSEIFQLMLEECNAVSSSLHRMVAQKETCQSHLSEMGARSDQIECYFKEMSSVSLPSDIASIQRMINEKQEIIQSHALDSERQLDALKQHQQCEQSMVKQTISDKSALINKLEIQISLEENTAEELKRDSETISQEKTEQIESLQRYLEELSNSSASIESEAHSTELEVSALTADIVALENELQQNKMQRDEIETCIFQLESSADELDKSLIEMDVEQKNLEPVLTKEQGLSRDLTMEFEEIKRQLLELQITYDNQVSTLLQALSEVSSKADEEEESLQKTLDEVRTKEFDVQNEEENIRNDLMNMQEGLQKNMQTYDQILQSNTFLENELLTIEGELQHSFKEKANIRELLCCEIRAAQEKEQGLIEMKSTYHQLILELEQQITSLTEEENSLAKELETEELNEREFHSQIESLEREICSSRLLAIKNNERIVGEYQETLIKLQEEIQMLRVDMEQETSELENDKKHLNECIKHKNILISGLKESMEDHLKELEGHKQMLNSLVEAQIEQGKCIDMLQNRISNNRGILELHAQQEEEISLCLQTERLKLQEIHCKIPILSNKLKKIQSDISVFHSDNDKQKQVLQRELKVFEKACEKLKGEIECVQRKSVMWKDKVATSQQELEEVQSKMASREKHFKNLQLKLNDIEADLAEWNEKVTTAMKEVEQEEIETALARKKSDNLKHKIINAKAAKAAKKQGEEVTWKVPANDAVPKGVVTPQNAGFADLEKSASKDITPKSILKPQTKVPTPQSLQKKVTFHEDFESASSSSTIEMVPEFVDKIEKNPMMMWKLVAERKELRRQKKIAEKGTEASTAEKAKQIETSRGHLSPQITVLKGPVTPQMGAIELEESASKEITPKSILKPRSKVPTPQSLKKNVSFSSTLDIFENSTSSDVLPSELGHNDGRNTALQPGKVIEKADIFSFHPYEEMDVALTQQHTKHLHDKTTPSKTFKRKLSGAYQEHTSHVASCHTVSEQAINPVFSGGCNKENSPRHILEPSTPLTQRSHPVFSDDLNCSGSSTSTIIMTADFADKLERNPNKLHELTIQQREVQRAAKRMKMSQSNNMDQFLKPAPPTPSRKVINDDEISSSTPENNRDWMP